MLLYIISFFSDHIQNLVSIVITTHVICARLHSAPYNGSLRLSLLLGDCRSKAQNKFYCKYLLKIFLPFISLEYSLVFLTKKKEGFLFFKTAKRKSEKRKEI